MPPRPRTLEEACRCGHMWALSDSRNGYSLDLPEDDYVGEYAKWRTECPNHGKPGHEAFCQRCDNSFPSQIGGVDFLRKEGVVETNPFQKFPEPLEPRKGPDGFPPLWEDLGSFIQRVPLAPKIQGRKIEEPTEVTAQEQNIMSDHDATRDLFRELLGMTGGANASGRGKMYIPDEIMDSMAGDAAQDSLARDRLIMEMRHREDRSYGARFVGLDLMEMEATDVDGFLQMARKKIIKRSKSTRKGCCMKIGGVLDQMLGSGGGEYLDHVQADDRGRHDPIGDANDSKTYKMVKEGVEVHHYDFPDVEAASAFHTGVMKHKNPNQAKGDRSGILGAQAGPIISKKPYVPVTFGEGGVESHGSKVADLAKQHGGKRRQQQDSVDVDLLNFIAEEFESWEHDADCMFADPKFSLDENEDRYFRAPKRPGLLREHFHLQEGAGIPMDKAKKALAYLKQKKAAGQLAGKEAALLPRLEKFVKMGGGGDDAEKQEEDVMVGPSHTANALASFMESSHEVNRYKAAKAGSGKGSPDSMSAPEAAGQHGLKTRDDNQQYPTSLAPAKGGDRRVAGQPQSLSTRGKDAGDPIGEDEGPRVSGTASALASFMEADATAKDVRLRLYGSDSDAKPGAGSAPAQRAKQPYGLPLRPAKGARQGKARFDPKAGDDEAARGAAYDKGPGKN